VSRSTRRAGLVLGVAAIIASLTTIDGGAAGSTSIASAVTSTPQASGDLLVTGFGDADGYHLFAAAAQQPGAWRALATLDPAPSVDTGWVGRQCLTGDGRYVVATVAPRPLAAQPEGVAHGGSTYAVNVTTDAVRPLASGTSLAYFSPACGVDDDVAITAFGTADDAPTTIVRVNAATGARSLTVTAPGEVTSAVPVADGVAAVQGTGLVGFAASGAEQPLAEVTGQPYDLHPNQVGGVDFLATPDQHSSVVDRWSPQGGLTTLGHGGLIGTSLFGGSGGRTAVVGASPSPSVDTPGLSWVTSPDPAALSALSLGLDGQLLDRGSGSQVVAPGASQGQAVHLPAPLKAAPLSAAPAATPSTPSGPPNQTTPTCAVPRNDVRRQITQPSYAQIDWAVQMATRSALTVARTGDPSWHLSAYYPSLDFPLGGVTVPREVMSGILATESNWDQASWHAIQGVGGNPLIADYYGYDSTTNTWDYNNADCGYGLSQRTDGMHMGDTQLSQNVQLAVALDYAENVAAGAATLVQKWNQLQAIGVIANNGVASDLENWYFAIWAYNSGVHPVDSTGAYGLGWANNPINPSYPPNRSPYRTVTTADSSHPSDWPYQEQVIGWMEVPLTDNVGANAYAPSAKYLELPDHALFCNTSNSCDPTKACPTSQSSCNSTTNQPCTRSDSECWWHQSVSWGDACVSNCTPATWSLGTTAAEPATPSNPYPPVCSLAASSSPAPAASALVVDDEGDGVPTDQHTSVNSGCPSSPSWYSNGSFSLSFGTNAKIDFHQLGVGFDGHIWFTHEVASSDPQDKVTGTWTPSIATAAGYNVWVFVPSDGATATDAQYVVNDGMGNQYSAAPVNQDAYSNQWVSLGNFLLAPGATVTLTNANANGATLDDLAFDALAVEQTSAGTQSADVAMGDSYSSGQGDPPFTNDSVDGCNRSVEGYPENLVNTDSTIYRGKLAFVACSGATTTDVVEGRNGEPPQTDWLSSATQLVTITIGGNDVGFGPILQACAQGTGCGPSSYPTLDEQIQAMQPKLRGLYTYVAAHAPNARLIVLTYPQIFPADPTFCSSAVVGAMSSGSILWARQEWHNFDVVVAQAALGLPGVQVLDEENAFAGHSACDGTPYANGIIWSAINNSFHPNWRGDQQTASDLEALLHLP